MLKDLPTPEQHLYSSRENEYLETGRFLENYKPEIRELHTIFAWEWNDDPEQINRRLKTMIGLEHSDTSSLPSCSPEQRAAAMDVFAQIGMLHEILPPTPTNYASIVVAGATTDAIALRLKLREAILAAGSTAEKTICLNGMRHRFASDGTDEHIIAAMGADPENPWILRELRKPQPFATETELGRVAALGMIGGSDTRVFRMNLPIITPTTLNTTPQGAARDITDYYYRDSSGHEIIIVNGQAVERGTIANGDKRTLRPTTTSTIDEWLDRHPPAEKDTILFITSQPHTLRMARELKESLEKHGLGSVQVDFASAGAPETIQPQRVLGEIARMIDREQTSLGLQP